ncbi:TRAP transporter substrate-binding protein DctP [Aquabacter sp. CN5-332]|uniref:TRAP transporter substrate-binding protein DctP n=1 Tax=Aquabacter sp. CN5-332 TaxID=3156608 RepID=UPI0032B455B6
MAAHARHRGERTSAEALARLRDGVLIAAFGVGLCLAGVPQAKAQAVSPPAGQKPLIAKWLDGEAQANFPKITYDGPPITLKYSSFVVAGTPLANLFIKSFKRLEEVSGGKLVVRPFWGSTLSNAQRGAFEAIGGGIADFGNCYTIFNPGGFSLHHGLAIPFIFSTSGASSTVAQELYVKYLKPEYEAKNVYLLRVATTRPNKILSKVPVVKLEDVKGKKIWTPGVLQAQFGEALGGIPTNVQTSELYSAFQSGVVDLATMHDAGSRLFKLMEIAKNRNDVNLWINPTEYCVNKASFDKLPPDLKALFYHWAQLWNQVDAQLYYDKEADEALADMNKRGIVSVTMPPEQLARWKAATQPVVDNWIKENEAKGAPAAKFIGDMKALADKYEKTPADEITQQLMDKPLPGIIVF